MRYVEGNGIAANVLDLGPSHQEREGQFPERRHPEHSQSLDSALREAV